MAIKILSDFDGVWTNQGPEAQHILEFAAAEIARCTGQEGTATLARFEALALETHQRPTNYGWAPQGRISAFVDEDPLLATNSVLHLIEDDPRDELRLWKSALVAGGFADLGEFANHCFNTSSAEFRKSHAPIMVEETRATFEAIMGHGIEICVVSNSRASKVVPWLREVGVDAGEGDGHAVRVYGDARKWQLSGQEQSLAIAGRTIYIDRPAYQRVLQEVEPDIIIGDVFSLDLALPHHLRSEGRQGGPKLLALRRHEHSPSWVTEERADGAIDAVVDHPRALIELAASLMS